MYFMDHSSESITKMKDTSAQERWIALNVQLASRQTSIDRHHTM